MIRLIPLLLFFASFSACKQKNLTLTELQEVKWDSLAPGVHVHTKDKKGTSFANDSIEIKLIGIAGGIIDPTETSLTEVSIELKEALSGTLRLYIPGSKSGYLKINIPDMIRPGMLIGKIYLRETYGSAYSFAHDSLLLQSIPGILSAKFCSKEEAKVKFLADGNSDWSKVLDSNPLPNSIDIQLVKEEWTEESVSDLKNQILDQIFMASDVSFPGSLLKKSDEDYFFSYKRK